MNIVLLESAFPDDTGDPFEKKSAKDDTKEILNSKY